MRTKNSEKKGKKSNAAEYSYLWQIASQFSTYWDQRIFNPDIFISLNTQIEGQVELNCN